MPNGLATLVLRVAAVNRETWGSREHILYAVDVTAYSR